jgi:hypothetical protein
MKKFLFSRSLIGLGAVIGTFAVLPLGVASADTQPSSACAGEQFSQPFLAFGDSNFYAPVPGESADSFDGAGWTLSGGASIVTTTLADGSQGHVLDLPAGSSAVSPAMCVSTGYPFGRMMTQVVGGANGPSLVTLGISGVGGNGQSRQLPVSGNSSTWGLSQVVPVAPGNPGTQQVTFTFTAAPNSTELQVYNLYVDPRML